VREGAVRAAAAVLALVALGACRGEQPKAYRVGTGGDPVRGRDVIAVKNCGSCHTIPGIPGARGVVAAPLTAFGLRSFVAGVLPNTPENLVVFIREPRRVEPRGAMPALGLDDRDARDVAAYLYTLR
jgi:mono/diheme cytochrome c family protein